MFVCSSIFILFSGLLWALKSHIQFQAYVSPLPTTGTKWRAWIFEYLNKIALEYYLYSYSCYFPSTNIFWFLFVGSWTTKYFQIFHRIFLKIWIYLYICSEPFFNICMSIFSDEYEYLNKNTLKYYLYSFLCYFWSTNIFGYIRIYSDIFSVHNVASKYIRISAHHCGDPPWRTPLTRAKLINEGRRCLLVSPWLCQKNESSNRDVRLFVRL